MTRAQLRRKASDPVRGAQWLLVDAAIWIASIWVSALLRAVLDEYVIDAIDVTLIAVLAAFVHTLIGIAQDRLIGSFDVATAEEVGILAIRVGVSLCVVMLVDLPTDPKLVPMLSIVTAGPIALSAMFGVRLLERLRRDHTSNGIAARANLRRAAVFGAGSAGKQVIDAIRRSSESELHPVALFDDDPHTWGRRFRDLRIIGGRDVVASAASDLDFTVLIVALPSAAAGVVDEIARLASSIALEVRVVPPLSALADGRVTLGDLHEFDDTELMPRDAVVDLTSVSEYLRDRVVLVTGAGGSIGSELCRQIDSHQPRHLVMVDRDETALHSVQMSIEGRALLDSPNLVIADIRDAERVDEVFSEWKPDVVFHAAALKHLTLLESHPIEGLKTNVFGTANLLESATRHGVERFVNVSTDKAANPTSVLGYTKAIAERLTTARAIELDKPFVCVRFGNVLGSRGSVLPAFKAQIARGGPVTVTHPEATRYMMTIPEAAHLVVQAGAIGSPGDALVLDMGEPVLILDIAKRVIERSGRQDVWIDFTGLRPGEKLHEDLFGDDEKPTASAHPAISLSKIDPLGFDAITALETVAREDAIALMREIAQRPMDANQIVAKP